VLVAVVVGQMVPVEQQLQVAALEAVEVVPLEQLERQIPVVELVVRRHITRSAQLVVLGLLFCAI
jgi:hypothetical protein